MDFQLDAMLTPPLPCRSPLRAVRRQRNTEDWPGVQANDSVPITIVGPDADYDQTDDIEDVLAKVQHLWPYKSSTNLLEANLQCSTLLRPPLTHNNVSDSSCYSQDFERSDTPPSLSSCSSTRTSYSDDSPVSLLTPAQEELQSDVHSEPPQEHSELASNQDSRTPEAEGVSNITKVTIIGRNCDAIEADPIYSIPPWSNNKDIVFELLDQLPAIVYRPQSASADDEDEASDGDWIAPHPAVRVPVRSSSIGGMSARTSTPRSRLSLDASRVSVASTQGLPKRSLSLRMRLGSKRLR